MSAPETETQNVEPRPAPDWKSAALDLMRVEPSATGVAVFDLSLTLIARNARAGEIFNVRHADTLEQLYGPASAKAAELARKCLASQSEIECDLVVDPAMVSGRKIRFRARPLRASGEAAAGAVALLTHDLTGAENAPRLETHVRQVLDALSVMAFVLDREGVLVEANASALSAAELQPSDVIGRPLGASYWWGWSAEAAERLNSALADARSGGAAQYRDRIRVGADAYRVVVIDLVALRDAQGEVARIVLTATDVSELVEIQERQELLAGELTHRAKNILAIVKALITRTARRAASKEALARSLEGRVSAMAATISQLSLKNWSSHDMEAAIREQLAPYGLERVSLRGESLALSPKAAMAIGLISYELASNASKYGALSTGEGRVLVQWRREGDEKLVLEWHERGGPAPEPAGEGGFGSTLIRNLAEGDLGAVVKIHYPPQGAEATLEIPFSRLTEASKNPLDMEAPSHAGPLAGRRILLAEDSPVIALDLKSLLESVGAIVIGPFAELSDLTKAAESEAYDAALLDIDLRGRSSLSAARIVRQRGAPVLFATADSNDAEARRDFPDAPVLPKPFSETELLDAIANLSKPLIRRG